jgi:hypothetical protein
VYSKFWANKLLGNEEVTLSILDLVNYGTIDCKLAALLWLLMERRASVLVAAGPSFVGKTTLLHDLLDFLPPDIQKISLQGYYEEFRFLNYGQPAKTYLVAEEISNHGFFGYLWGHQAAKVFKLMPQGYALGGTMHARSSEEVIYILHRILGIPMTLISRLGVIVTLRVTGNWDYETEPLRRINSVDLILPHPEGVAIQVLAAQQNTGKSFDYQKETILQKVLADKFLTGTQHVGEEIETRRRFLKHLLDKGQTSCNEVREAILEYYRSKSPR